MNNAPVGPGEVHGGSPNKAWWICAQGHEWFAPIRDRVRKGVGCPFCKGKLASTTNCVGARPQALKLWHPEKNLPATAWTTVAGSNRKVWWTCEEGHSWQAPPNNVCRGSGCPRCVDAKDSKRERDCREIIERLTGQSFPKAKPLWLISDRGFQLELDGYSETLKMAFEHHGIQHYRHVPFFHSVQKFKRTQELDAVKRARCTERGVLLIEIRWDIADIEAFLQSQLSGGVR